MSPRPATADVLACSNNENEALLNRIKFDESDTKSEEPVACDTLVSQTKSSYEEPRNISMRLRNREVCNRNSWNFRYKNSETMFSNMRVRAMLDTHDPERSNLRLHLLRMRSKVSEVVAAGDVLAVLTESGVCAIFSVDSGALVCFVNLPSDEVVRSLFYNKYNNNLVVCSVFPSDRFGCLKCRTIPIPYMRNGRQHTVIPLFETESLKWPGFVEFDDVNAKVITHSTPDGTYKVWDLATYKFQYSFQDSEIQEIKISPGIMLLIYKRKSSYVTLKIISIHDGSVLRKFDHPLHKTKGIDFIEQFNQKLLVKQENEDLQIYDVMDCSLKSIPRKSFVTPNAFIFLYALQKFLTFRFHSVSVWNFNGELVTNLADNVMWLPENSNNVFITSQQDMIFSYSRQPILDGSHSSGCITVSCIHTGRCIQRVRCHSHEHTQDECPLENVTAVFYNDERGEIYSGTADGKVAIWAN
mmetsp:Transcript_42037/g.68203  ORF Transcript_42037/g.68203 Transcript_42037/m.68203 type:complete len:470 (+) Transcript_42037:210-1619(+)